MSPPLRRRDFVRNVLVGGAGLAAVGIGLPRVLRRRAEEASKVGFPFSTSFWFDPEIETSPPLRGERNVDVAVVRGGFAGLSAARHLKLRAPGLGVALVEARHVGFGASGRNAGGVMGLPPLYWLLEDLEDRRRLDDVSFTARLARESNVEVGRLVEREAIDCDWKPSRHVLVARSALEVATLRWLAPRFEAIGVPCERYDDEQVRQLVGYPAKAAVAYEIATIQPYRLARGLRRLCIAQGVQVYEGTRVARIQSAREGVRLTTSSGAILTAGKVILATNAYTRFVEVEAEVPGTSTYHTYMLATEPLEDGMIDRIGRARTPFGDAAMSLYIGRIHERRLIFNGIDRSSGATSEDDRHLPSFAKLRGEMVRRFPFLDAVPLAGAWAGPVQETQSDAPIVRPAAGNPDVILNIGYGGGSGVGMALLSGRLTTDLALGNTAADPDAQRLRALLANSRFPPMGPVRAAFAVLRGLLSR